jgi:two-component system osmolarity sensor histidine kinase EnvZ
MAADIAQLDAIIDKFLDYARPGQAVLSPVSLAEIVEACVYPFKDSDDIRVNVDVPPNLRVMADEVELARVISNLLENARRYGKSVETGVAIVDIASRARDHWILIKVRDHGIGVSPDALANLTKPFFRGDAARTAATGAGLGLSIVDKTVQRMGGSFVLVNGSTGGLSAHIKLHEAR